ncbi:hypothetical protein CICLE_v10013266mg [Citrus x clementina]|uniref:HTH myb-type domain-containing protein n=1 Tax=Citrus clementina TaxID=85681 RepID=V4S2V9_CITCL|nr:hypothetical protein CICLE_v10013266mg [Citrus x clementina]
MSGMMMPLSRKEVDIDEDSNSGLKRSGKSCRLRWLNYLRPNIKHGYISTEEEQIIIQLHKNIKIYLHGHTIK